MSKEAVPIYHNSNSLHVNQTGIAFLVHEG